MFKHHTLSTQNPVFLLGMPSPHRVGYPQGSLGFSGTSVEKG